MKTYQVLEKALALIEDKKNWCQRYRFDGLQKCALRSLDEIENFQAISGAAYCVLVDLIAASSPGESLGEFNDTHSHAEVVALFQQAIRTEKQKEGIPLDIPEPVKVAA